MTNDRRLSKLDTARDLALRDGDTRAAAEYERRINELLEEDRAKAMKHMGQHRLIVPREYFLRMGEKN